MTTRNDLQFPEQEQGVDGNVAKDAGQLITKEMLGLSSKERNAILEEVHGVHCTIQEETPEFVQELLDRLASELEKIPCSEKQAYLRSQKMEGSYVQSKNFLVRFLRAVRYDNVPWVARKIVMFLELVSELFGDIALQRPICLSDFSPRELICLRKGRYQFLPFADRIGRRILVAFMDDVWESFPAKTKAKIVFYHSWTAGSMISSQRKGIVFVMWFDEQFKIPQTSRDRKFQNHALHSTAVTALHACTPDTPFYRIRGAVLKFRIGRTRRYLQTHIGNSVENRYALQSYGIPIDQFPISFSGKIKAKYAKQWVAARMAIEKAQAKGDPVPKGIEIIEYPQPEDVVFRPGMSCSHHSGNHSFRQLLLSMIQKQEISGVRHSLQRKPMVVAAKTEVWDKDGGRFLIWNDEGWWNELVDEKKINSRIEFQIKELRNLMRRQTKRTILKADTSKFGSYQNETKCCRNSNDRPGSSVDDDNCDIEFAEAINCVRECFGTDLFSSCR